MHIGITIPNLGPFCHPRAVASLASEAEAAGFEGLFIWDHVIFGPAPVGDPWIALAAAAMSTEKIFLGPIVTPLPRRRPIKLARETTSLDLLSGGRLILGVGTGLGPGEWDYLGEESDPRARGRMLDEELEILTKAWSGQPFRFEGEYYRLCGDLPGGNLIIQPTPVSRIPVWVGGMWPSKRPFKRAARWDGVVPMKAGQGLGKAVTPQDLEEIVRYTLAGRTSDEPFDVVVAGHTSGTDFKEDADTISAYRDAGATW